MLRLVDYHTVRGIRRASGAVAADATVQTYRHYLLDARFGVLVEGPGALLDTIAAALRNPVWGMWLGRKCCLPASPLLAAAPSDRSTAWTTLLMRAGYAGTELEEQFDRVMETDSTAADSDVIDDTPIAFGNPIGERHSARWIRRVPKSGSGHPRIEPG